MTHPTDDLAPLFTPPQVESNAAIAFGQGRLRAWDPLTFDNEVEYRGAVLTNVPILGALEGISLAPGDVVGIWSWRGAYFVAGRLKKPDPESGVFIRFGGRFETRHWDSSRAVQVGNIFDPGDPASGIHGINFENRAGPQVLFRVEQGQESPTGILFMGDSTPGDSAELDAVSATTRLTTMGSLTGAGDVVLGFPDTGTPDTVWIDHTTTGSAANCVIGTNGVIQRSTSSVRYKTDIEDLPVDPAAVLALRPRTWRDKAEVDRNPAVARWHVGLVAEEVAQLLPEFVDYDEQGRAEGIAYDRLTVALLTVAQGQQRRLDALAARVAALDGQAEPAPAPVTREPKPLRRPLPTSRRAPRPRPRHLAPLREDS